MAEREWDPGLDPALRETVDQRFINQGSLYGALPEEVLEDPQKRQLLHAGWSRRPYRDGSVWEPPTATVEWERLRRAYRDVVLHAVNHRAPANTPWVGPRLEILDAVVESSWEEREEGIRVLLSAWAFTSLWQATPESPQVEGQQVFFFYTARMRDAALRALNESLAPPADDDPFWEMVQALIEG
ncbi:MAG: hypothetical protein K6U14_02945 [Firmicutes bacterium]|nr:hypothetical protein [Alicyclobacillaceae bacterium]MCL6496577.1 hypothetical protein [Bacillota bacterium]